MSKLKDRFLKIWLYITGAFVLFTLLTVVVFNFQSKEIISYIESIWNAPVTGYIPPEFLPLYCIFGITVIIFVTWSIGSLILLLRIIALSVFKYISNLKGGKKFNDKHQT